MKFISHHPRATMASMGLIPYMLSENDPRPAKEQLNSGYGHGGGWQPFNGFTKDGQDRLHYLGDPPQVPRCELHLRNERIVMYDHAWIAIIQPDGQFEVCRMD